MYKLNFPLEEFKGINSLLSEYYSEYFFHNGNIYGRSLNSWCYNVGILPDDFMKKIHMEDIVIPPNFMRSILSTCKKTMTYIPPIETDFKIYQFDEKIKDIPDLSKGKLTLSIPVESMDGKTDMAEHMRDIYIITSIYQQAALDELKRGSFHNIPQETYYESFQADDVVVITSPENSRDTVMFTRQMFPKYQKIENMSWTTLPLSQEYGIAVFKSDYPDLSMLTYVKYVRGI